MNENELAGAPAPEQAPTGQYAVISLICPVANTFVAAGNLGV